MSDAQTSLFDSSFLAKLEQLRPVDRHWIRGFYAGGRKSKMLGSSLDFADYRAYMPGDDIRQIDWALYARLKKWMMKTYLDEREMLVSIYIDVSRSMGMGKEMVRKLAAGLVYLALYHGDRCALYSFTDQVKQLIPAQQGRQRIPAFFKQLEQLTFAEKGDATKALQSTAAIPRNSGCAIVITDGFFEKGWEESLLRLRAAGQEVILLHVVSKEEREPSLVGDLRLVDSETQSEKEVAISPYILSLYKERFEKYVKDLEEWCFRQQIFYLLIPAEESFEQIFFTLFRRKGLYR